MAKKESQNNLILFDIMKKEVTYHNDFSNTIFNDFTLKEKQLLLFLIAGIKDTDPDNKVYNFNPKEVKRMLNMTRKSYSLLSEFVFSIQKKPLTILKPDKKIEAISIFDKVVYSPNDDSIDVKWGNSAIEFFKKIKTNFSEYFLENILKLKNENSVEFYLRAESNLYKGWFDIEGEDIPKIFNVKYPDLYNVKRFLINVCLKDINKNTDINIQVKNKIKGRKITGFSFIVKRKVNLSDKLTQKIEKIKKNIYISRSGFFNKGNLEKTLHRLFRDFSNEELIQGLGLCYDTIKNDFSSFGYLKNAIKYALENDKITKEEKNKLKKVEIIDKNVNIEDAIIVKTNSEKDEDLKIEKINSKGIENIQLITKVLDQEINIKENIKNKKSSLDYFKSLSEEKQAKIEIKALEKFKEKNGENNFLITMKHNSPTMYYNTLKPYILEAMEENTIEEAEIIEVKEPVKVDQKKLVKKTISAPKKRGRRKKLDMLEELDKNEEVSKNEKKIISFVKKIYGKEKANEIILLENEKKIEVFWSYYIELLKFNEEQKKK